jgi:predicted Rossmann-fold nucleotide-binding protein
LSDPIAAVGVDFWKPTLDALKKVAVTDRQLISSEDAARLFVSDDAHALLDHMLPKGEPAKGFEVEPKKLAATLLKEVDVVTKGLRELRPAVAFLGGERLSDNDPTMAIAKQLSAYVADTGAAVRVGDDGNAATAVVKSATNAGADAAHVQAVMWQAPSSKPASTSTLTSSEKQTTVILSERIPHKELLLRSAEAYVVLPSGLKGLDEFATVLCQMQNDKLPLRPLILVGSDYWQPLLDAWKKTMLSDERKLISPEDMDLVTVVDSVEAAQAALTNLR